MNSEKGVTLTILVIYVIFFSIIISLLATLSNYIYKNIGYVNEKNIDISEFNKFNMYFIEDVKNNKQAEIKEITNDKGELILQITFEDGDSYKYIQGEKAIYKNKQKIAKNIQIFEAEQFKNNTSNKKYIEVNIEIGSNDEANYKKRINYVLKYW